MFREKSISELVNSNNWRDRLRAVNMISNNPTEQNIIFLLKLLGDPDWSVSKESEDLFIKLGNKGKEYLIKYGLTSEYDVIRRKAYYLLIKMGYKHEAALNLAEYYEKSGNYEKAADIYEKIGETSMAEKMRKKAKEKYVYQKTVNINVDMDHLLEYIRSNGLTVKYTCPSCGANIEIDGKQKIYYCPYCGTKIEIVDIQNLLENLIQ